jgi:hypothetical protein
MRYEAVVKGGLHANYSGDIASIHLTTNNAWSTRAVQILSRKGMYAFRELVDSLVNGAVGDDVRFRYAEIAASEELGGVRTVNTDSYLIDRDTTAADVLNVKAGLTEHSELTHTVSQATNLDRNPLGTR